MKYNRNSFYDGTQKYKIVAGTIQDHKIIADGFTSQKSVKEYYKKLREQGINTRELFTIGYK